jgi:uncharacterized delta-60 repeat protein
MVSTSTRRCRVIFGAGLACLTGCGAANNDAEPESRQQSAALEVGAPGTLDPRFGNAGLVLTDFGGTSASAAGVTVQRDGKILVGGSSESGDPGSSFALARYECNGALDPSFGIAGKALTGFAGGSVSGDAIAVQGDDKLVIAGSYGSGDGTGDFALARYRHDGALDSSFGVGGQVLSDLGGRHISVADAVAVQPDDKIIVAGATAPEGPGDYNCVLARYDRHGALDTSFGVDGQVVTDFGGEFNQSFQAVAIQADGKIVATGFNKTLSFTISIATARYNRDGSLDTSFGTGGKILTNFGGPSSANAVALQRDGKILIAGSVSVADGTGPIEALLARFDRNGTLDPTFGDAGRVLSEFAGGPAVARALLVEDSGEIVAVGAFPAPGSSGVLARYSSRGVLDPSFGANGSVAGPSLNPVSAALEPDGQILVVGPSLPVSGTTEFAVARYQGVEVQHHRGLGSRYER